MKQVFMAKVLELTDFAGFVCFLCVTWQEF